MNSRIKDVVFVNEKLLSAYLKLKDGKFEDHDLFKFVSRAKDDLSRDPLCGINVPLKLIPKVYIKKYGVSNLWKYDLPDGWRLLYTIKGNEVKIVSVILEWMNHKEYERRFGY